MKVSDPLKRVLSFYWTLTDPGGDVIQASIEATRVPYFIIKGGARSGSCMPI